MLKLAHILPVDVLRRRKVTDTGTDFVLAHLYMENQEYREYYKEKAKTSTVLLDNGEYEQSRVSNEDLIEVARDLEPSYIFLPDVRGSQDKTIEEHRHFLVEYSHNLKPKTNILGILQYDTKDPYYSALYMYHKLKELVGISGVGFTQLEDNMELIRYKILKTIEKEEGIKNSFYHHALGTIRTAKEAKAISSIPWVSSLDSAKWWQWAEKSVVDNELLKENHEGERRPKNYFDKKYTDPDIRCIEHKIKQFDEYIGVNVERISL
jgi:hypothetical protein